MYSGSKVSVGNKDFLLDFYFREIEEWDRFLNMGNL